MTRLRHLDLFSGIGGFSLGLEATGGFKTIGFSEIEPWCCAVLKKHWPKVKNYGDIGTIPAVECDIITGGFPCQPFSVAGQQRGAEDDRHLWPSMLDVITQNRPAWVVCENVPGIIDMELDNCIADLEDAGYEVQPFIVPACAVGCLHRRDRIFLLANNYKNKHNRNKNRERENCKKRTRNSEAKQAGRSRFSKLVTNVPAARDCSYAELRGEFYGIPKGVDRIERIGNSIVPQIAQIIGETILATYA